MIKKHSLGLFLLSTIFALLISACSSNTPETPQAKKYKVVTVDAYSSKRKRFNITITAPDAKTFDELAHTAMKAAIDMQSKKSAKVVYVYVASPGNLKWVPKYAIAKYAPDNGGNSGKDGWTWQVEAAKKLPTDKGLQIAKLWQKHRDSFQVDESTDGDRLKQFIAKELSIEIKQVGLPDVFREKYNIKS